MGSSCPTRRRAPLPGSLSGRVTSPNDTIRSQHHLFTEVPGGTQSLHFFFVIIAFQRNSRRGCDVSADMYPCHLMQARLAFQAKANPPHQPKSTVRPRQQRSAHATMAQSGMTLSLI